MRSAKLRRLWLFILSSRVGCLRQKNFERKKCGDRAFLLWFQSYFRLFSFKPCAARETSTMHRATMCGIFMISIKNEVWLLYTISLYSLVLYGNPTCSGRYSATKHWLELYVSITTRTRHCVCAKRCIFYCLNFRLQTFKANMENFFFRKLADSPFEEQAMFIDNVFS